MLRTAVALDDTCLEHDTGPGHPERAARLQTVARAVDRTAPERLVRLPPRAATLDELRRVHSVEHVARVAATAERDRFAFDADTPTSSRSFEAALRAAGGTLAAVDAVMAGAAANGFALVRPPGHHAVPERAMGFCLFNNVAVAAAHLRATHGLERVLVVDWDVHHGNGTQDAFYADSHVLFMSSHQYPFYPGTGSAREVGRGEGEGFTLNVPLPGGCGDAEYLQAYLEVVEPVARQFRPEFVLISAGFDAHARDPLAEMEVSERGFAGLARLVARIARDVCGSRLVAVLEGGYDLGALGESVVTVLDELGGARLDEPVTPPASDRRAPIDQTREVARHYWRI
jgi:acetoin utilization deacetylase AcuC-like enzyme